MNNSLLYFTKNDIPYNSAKIIIHTPTVNELGLISEESFRIACQMILHLPEITKSQDNFNSSDKSDFDIFIAIINGREEESQKYKKHLFSFFSLLFPNYKVRVRETDIQLMEMIENGNVTFIDNTNFSEFQEIISNMFAATDNSIDSASYKPADERAKKIAEKLNKAKGKSAKNNGQIKEISVYKRYASILGIGLAMDINVLLNYSVEQIENQFNRFVLKTKWDTYFNAKMAGASDLDEVDDWMKEI